MRLGLDAAEPNRGGIMNRPRIRLLILFLCGMCSVVVALKLLGRVDRFILLWPVSGIEIGLLLPEWKRCPKDRILFLSAVGSGVFLGGIAVGMPLELALPIAGFTCLDVWLGCWWLGATVHGFDDLKRTPNLVRFVQVAVFAPVVTGMLGSLPVSLFLHEPLLLTAVMSTLANSLGIALLVPVVLFAVNGWLRSNLVALMRRGWAGGSLLLFVAISAFVFAQRSGPFLFMVFPPLILVVLALGLEGAMLSSVLLTGIGWVGTNHGRGPISLLIHATPEFRLAVLQGFIWVAIATALPIGALLDERRKAERKAEEARSIYETLLDHANDLIVLSSLDGTGRYVSPAVEKITGWTPAEYLQMSRLDTLHPEDRDIGQTLLEELANGNGEHRIRYRLMRKDGSWVWVEASVSAYKHAETQEIAGYVGTVRDISQLILTEETWEAERAGLTGEQRRLVKLAHTDPLTGLLNRRGLDEAMQRHSHRKNDDPVALLMIDVDYFKLYNDSLGHAMGDECLKHVARVLSTRIGRRGDLVARVGGEEFVVVLRGSDISGGVRAAEDILKGVRELKLEHPMSPLKIMTVSVGITASRPSDNFDLATLQAAADEGLYVSKRNGRNRATVAGLPMAAMSA